MQKSMCEREGVDEAQAKKEKGEERGRERDERSVCVLKEGN